MFEKFSESARRVVFWARAEAGRLRAEAIEPEHLLLGFLAEDQGESWQVPMMESQFKDIARNIAPQIPSRKSFFTSDKATQIRELLGETVNPGDPQPESAGMPLAEQAFRALQSAQTHAERSSVGSLHIL